MHELHFGGKRVAVTGCGHAYLDAQVAELPAHHPARRFVAAMCLFCLAIDEGVLAGPYDDARAEQFARVALISDDELLSSWEETDERLDARFRVPAGQVAARRFELLRET